MNSLWVFPLTVEFWPKLDPSGLGFVRICYFLTPWFLAEKRRFLHKSLFLSKKIFFLFFWFQYDNFDVFCTLLHFGQKISNLAPCSLTYKGHFWTLFALWKDRFLLCIKIGLKLIEFPSNWFLWKRLELLFEKRIDFVEIASIWRAETSFQVSATYVSPFVSVPKMTTQICLC